MSSPTLPPWMLGRALSSPPFEKEEVLELERALFLVVFFLPFPPPTAPLGPPLPPLLPLPPFLPFVFDLIKPISALKRFRMTYKTKIQRMVHG